MMESNPIENNNQIQKRPIATRTNGSMDDRPIPHLNRDQYLKLYKQSIDQPDQFWDNVCHFHSISHPSPLRFPSHEQAKQLIDWIRPYTSISEGDFKISNPDEPISGNFTWFKDGGLNACYNCVDRWASKHPHKKAIIWIADEECDSLEISYKELLEDVCRLANLLKSYGVEKGDTVAIYLPMIPAAVISFLACARIGAIHSVIFAGFSSDSLKDRIEDCKTKIIITSDEAKRGGKTIPTKKIVDEAITSLKEPKMIEKVIVFDRTNSKEIKMIKDRDIRWDDVKDLQRPFCPIEIMDSEDALFILYTSGSTGKPKGLLHSTAGYLLGAAMTLKYVFDIHPDDRFACMADVGWITGHTYIVYGPLMNGITTTVFESTPIYPNPSRYWQSVEKYRLTQFYTAPTAIRLLKKLGEKYVEGFDLSSLRIIGSVGEPINPEAWEWYNECIGKSQCAVVDTYWQTETGSIIISPIPGATETKPGSATLPMFGIEPCLLEPITGQEVKEEGILVLKRPWPSMARTIFNDHSRYLDTYLKVFKGFYFTGDGAGIDSDGYFWIKGRVDDVLNVSGHRLSTAEIESALVQNGCVAETAVVGAPDETTGQSIYAFVTLKDEYKKKVSIDEEEQNKIKKDLIMIVRKVIGPFASPKQIIFIDDLPKTRSGKIMRRILRKIVCLELDSLGDLSTLSDPLVVQKIIDKVDLISK